MSHQSDLIATDIDAYLKQHEHKELLRFLTCGSVDDGKSTLIGRDDDDLGVLELRPPAQLARELEAVELGHHDVGDDAVGVALRNLAQRLAAGLEKHDLMAAPLEEHADKGQNVGVVVYDIELHLL